jgi:hypothetical protein
MTRTDGATAVVREPGAGGSDDSSFSGNSANSFNSTLGPGAGGAILNIATVTVTQSSFANNSAAWGGGIANADGALTVTGCTFSSNLAKFGGGVYNNFGAASVSGVTFEQFRAAWLAEPGHFGGPVRVTHARRDFWAIALGPPAAALVYQAAARTERIDRHPVCLGVEKFRQLSQ